MDKQKRTPLRFTHSKFHEAKKKKILNDQNILKWYVSIYFLFIHWIWPVKKVIHNQICPRKLIFSAPNLHWTQDVFEKKKITHPWLCKNFCLQLQGLKALVIFSSIYYYRLHYLWLLQTFIIEYKLWGGGLTIYY